jgi:murein DD-endopeptidase MepM/ murein hydrolase activator NlpD
VTREQVPCDRRLERIGGRIDSSLFGAVDALGEDDALAMALIDVLAWDVDFAHESQPGDRFTLIVEKLYVDGRRIGYGPILAVEYAGPGRVVRNFSLPRQEGRADGPMDHFTAAGESCRKAFLKSPLRFSRISSGFTNRRLHPVTGRVQPHYAIDYAAPSGTPVWAVGDGIVRRASWDGGGGRAVSISHPGGYESFYLHLSGFARGLAPGKRVSQKQVIGYVGSTGVATGPHLDYRLRKQGRYVNPLREEFDRAEPVPLIRRGEFDRRVSWLGGLLDRPLPEGVTLLEGETSSPPASYGATSGRELTLRR